MIRNMDYIRNLLFLDYEFEESDTDCNYKVCFIFSYFIDLLCLLVSK